MVRDKFDLLTDFLFGISFLGMGVYLMGVFGYGLVYVFLGMLFIIIGGFSLIFFENIIKLIGWSNGRRTETRG